MRMGIHANKLAPSAQDADQIIWADLSGNNELGWLTPELSEFTNQHIEISVDAIQGVVDRFIEMHGGTKVHVLMMSNGGFGGVREALLKKLGSE